MGDYIFDDGYMPRINLTNAQFQAASQFASDLIDMRGDYYWIERNASDYLFIQHRNAKLAELAAFDYLTARGEIVSPPDMTIHTSAQRQAIGFDPDLVSRDGKRFHVKSYSVDQSMVSESYTFQLSDPLLKKSDENDHIICVVIDAKDRVCWIRADIVFSDWRARLKNPKLTIHWGKKLCLYLYDLLASTYTAA